MQRATLIVRKAAVRPEKVVDRITLDHQARHRRRVAMTADGGTEFLLDLGAAAVLDAGDALKLADGGLVEVAAADESLIEITASSPLRLMRLGWHLGNRHVPAEITAEALFIQPDHVLVEMVRGLGAKTVPVTRPFQPERGAYHEHAAPDHGQEHAHGEHVHGDGCGCGHGR